MYLEVPVSGKLITAEDILKGIEAVMDGWFTDGGRFCDEFSDKLKKYIGVSHCSLVNSGSSANLLAVTAIKDFYTIDKDHNKVVTCATGFPTTISAIVHAGLVPYFIDVNPKTLNPDTNIMLEALSRDDIVGIIQAHTLGFPFDAKAIREYCDAHGKFFIEDCSDALGAEIYGEKVGIFGHASTLSFYPAHQITAGEGGAVLTNDGKLMRQVEVYRDWGRSCWCEPGHDNTCNNRFGWKWANLPEGYDHKYTYIKFGYNLKMTEMQAALGSSQMDKIDEFVYWRWKNYQHLHIELDDLSDEIIDGAYQDNLFTFYDYLSKGYSLSRDFSAWYDVKLSPFGFPITVTTDKFTRKELVDYLEENGVVTRPVFAGNITRQPMFDNVEYEVHGDLSGSDYVMERTFWVGCAPLLTQEQLDYVVTVFDEFFKMKGLK